jgi:hypothetical protein
MGLKGYRLWAMGQLDSTCRAPPHPRVLVLYPLKIAATLFRAVVVAKLSLKKHMLKPGYHIKGSRVETRCFQAMGQLHSTCTAPPWW